MGRMGLGCRISGRRNVWNGCGRSSFNTRRAEDRYFKSLGKGAKHVCAYTWKNGDAPVRMIRTDEGICVLSGIAGGLRGEGENVRVYPGDDGYWYLGGRSGVALTVHALALRPVKATTFRALYSEAVWDAKTGPIKMIGKDEGFCFISGVGGKYEGASEIARVSVGQDGFWCLDGQSRQNTMSARAISVRILPPR